MGNKLDEAQVDGESASNRLLGGVAATLQVACDQLEYLKENRCLHDCASAAILEDHLKLALGLVDAALGKTKSIEEIRASLKGDA